MKVTTKAKKTEASYTVGGGQLVIDSDDTYTENEIVINALATGTVTVRAKSRGSDGFESVDGGSIDLTTNKSLMIQNRQLEEIEISVAPDASFDVILWQY